METVGTVTTFDFVFIEFLLLDEVKYKYKKVN
jgi:hypothetical protein